MKTMPPAWSIYRSTAHPADSYIVTNISFGLIGIFSINELLSLKIPQMQERWLKVIGIVFTLSMNVQLKELLLEDLTRKDLLQIFIVLISVIAQWELAHLITRLMRKYFSGLTQTRKRFALTFLACVPAIIFIQIVTDIILHKALPGETILSVDRLWVIFWYSTFVSFTCIGLYESGYYYSRFSKSELEKEELRRSNLLSQFESLKTQVNPHFLFNSLNSLSALISRDPPKAEQFVEEMSNVYRYLLRSSEQELITIREEMDYLQSFLHLLRTRFGEALQADINILPDHLDDLIPPLTVQILVENAIKYNELSRENPLEVMIFSTTSDRLHIVNNLQRKHREVSSGKVGLSNIIGKYRLLKQADVEVHDTGEEFMVMLPLIKTRENAGITR